MNACGVMGLITTQHELDCRFCLGLACGIKAGNRAAQQVLSEVFEVTDRAWRGIGVIPRSGWRLRPEYRKFDAAHRFAVADIQTSESPLCHSGEVLQGRLKPNDCPAFGKECTPRQPLGATMVSSEGACAAYFNYGRFHRISAATSAAV